MTDISGNRGLLMDDLVANVGCDGFVGLVAKVLMAVLMVKTDDLGVDRGVERLWIFVVLILTAEDVDELGLHRKMKGFMVDEVGWRVSGWRGSWVFGSEGLR